jgi:hypothetical protein
MKLELKHLAPYLPYGLKVRLKTRGTVYELIGVTPKGIILKGVDEVIWFKNIELILRSLSDLEDDEYKNKIFNREYIIDKQTDSYLDHYEWCFLFENHFDVFGLIDAGLAIDINTLES